VIPADDFAAEEVHDQVQEEEPTFDGRGQVGDIPAPKLVGCRGLEGQWALVARRAALAPGLELLGLAQHPVEGCFRGEIAAPIGQCRDDLARPQMGELGLIDHPEDLLALGVAQAIGRHPTLGGRGAPIRAEALLLTPALQGARRDAEPLAGLLQPGAGAAQASSISWLTLSRCSRSILRPRAPRTASGLFFEHQQRGRLGQGLVLAPQLLLQGLDQGRGLFALNSPPCSPFMRRFAQPLTPTHPRRPSGSAGRIRRLGGGRRKATEAQAGLEEAVEVILEAHSAGSPTEESVRWTDLKPMQLAKELFERG
jgi:hypothetical protein